MKRVALEPILMQQVTSMLVSLSMEKEMVLEHCTIQMGKRQKGHGVMTNYKGKDY